MVLSKQADNGQKIIEERMLTKRKVGTRERTKSTVFPT